MVTLGLLLQPGRRSIKLLLSCVAGSKFLGRGVVEMDADLVAVALGRAFGGMNTIFDRFDFPEDELETMSNGLIEGSAAGRHGVSGRHTQGLAADDANDNLRIKNPCQITVGSVASFDYRQFARRSKNLGLMSAGTALS